MVTLLTVMGSGETTPTMVTSHQRVLAAVGPNPTALLLDTPYGFQENADEVTDKARRYFAGSVGVPVEVASLRRVRDLSPVRLEALLTEVREADWVFAGPGSPTYLLRQWCATSLPEVLAERLRRDGATTFASAAAATLGSRAVPVYEIYKAGQEPHWVDGLGLLPRLGLDAVCIPHYDNHDGGTHDTRYCYLGERRLRALEQQLTDSTWVLGVDEHTAVVLELGAGRVRVEGRGGLTVRARDVAVRFPAGSELGLEELVAAACGTATAAPMGADASGDAEADGDTAGVTAPADPETAAMAPLPERVSASAAAFDAAMGEGRALDAAETSVALEAAIRAWASDVADLGHLDRARAELRRQVTVLARAAQAGMHEHRDLVAPHVEVLLGLRERARREGRFDEADAIRQALAAGGVEVRDGAEGASWAYQEPDTGGS